MMDERSQCSVVVEFNVCLPKIEENPGQRKPRFIQRLFRREDHCTQDIFCRRKLWISLVVLHVLLPMTLHSSDMLQVARGKNSIGHTVR